MLSPSEEVTKTWIKKKGILIKSRPRPSRFSFVVCLAIVFSIAFGFLGGFITAGLALNENYSSVYENLLTELEDTRRCIEREKEKLASINKAFEGPTGPPQIYHANAVKTQDNNIHMQVHEQAIFSVFGHAVELLQKNDKINGCKELSNIININDYRGEWRSKAQYLLNKNCR